MIAGSAEDLLRETRRRGIEGVDYVISGVPLANLGRTRALALIAVVSEALTEDGVYIQFQHSTQHLSCIKARFRNVRTVPVLLNVPPAVVYYARK